MTARAQRLASGAGVVFVVLFVFGTFNAMAGPGHNSDSPAVADQRLLHWLSSSGNRAEQVMGAYALLLAAIAFVWFCTGLRSRIEAVEGPGSAAGRLVSGLSVLAVVGIVGAAMMAADIAGAVSVGGEPLPANGDSARMIENLTFPFLFVVFGLASAALIAVVVTSALRSGSLPRWAGYTGIVAVVGSVFAIVFIPMVLPMLWYLAVAISGLSDAAVRQTVPAPAVAT